MTRARLLNSFVLTLPLSVMGPLVGTAVAGALLLAPQSAQAADEAVLSGVVTHANTGKRIPGALVILQCNCLQGTREFTTTQNGLYAFKALPPGTYTIQVLKGGADISKVVTVPRSAKFRANFKIDPDDEITKTIVIKPLIKQDTSVTTSMSMDDFHNIPVGDSTGRDWTDVAEASATVNKGPAGLQIAGTDGASSKYVVDGMNANDPSFGTVGASIVQEFIEDVEVQESGYAAEFGGASGGQVTARRVSGTNKIRGVARFTYTPRLAQPRFILATDNAVRAIEVPDYLLQGVVVASGPIIEDKLFWSAGVTASGGRASLIQSFHSRVDKDGSGGFEDCPYKNGDFDCVDGGDYIQTEKFAEQRFRTGNIGVGYQIGLDWAISPKHRLQLTVRGGPNFQRRSYRRPALNLDPSSFGTAQNADPLGGGANTANGVVNDHFGWDRGNFTTVGLGYLGRVADDKIEIDAGLGFSQFANEEAWRLDNPEHYDRPATQQQDNQGANLFTFLDSDDKRALVGGVDDACNSRDLPGLACPTRRWLSGGIGNYSSDKSRRFEGRLALTHFLSTRKAGSHQLKYGAQVEYLQRETLSRYSGRNDSDFFEDCEAGQTDGGEYCYDRLSGYQINNATRVDNHRLIRVDTDNPDARTSFGFGRVRKEEGELRAIATDLGAGVRVAAYNETTSTTNYGVFLQDKWAITSNLFLTAGVRWELQDMRDINGDRAVFINDNVAPRVGVVYDWTDEGKSRLFASYGWFYQPLPLQLNSRVFGGLVNVTRSYRNADCQEGASVTVEGESRFRLQDGQPTEFCPDFNTGTTQLTEGAVVPKLRGQYNQQFQAGYEQEVIEDLTLGVRWQHTDLGRAVEDISTNGGLNFIIANPGEAVSQSDLNAELARCDSLQAQIDGLEMDSNDRNQLAREHQRCEFLVDAYGKVGSMFSKPTRNFDAFTFEVKKRFARNWMVIGSYTFSRLVGNYDGFVDPTTGAINLGASTQYDIPELVRNSFGPLSFNTPHRAKVNGFYSFDLQEAGRLTLGTSANYRSGYPISLRADNNRYPGQYAVYVLPRGAAGRVEPTYSVNMSVNYAYPLKDGLELEVGARLFNVTNAKAVLRVDEVYSFSNTRPVAGGELSDLKHTKIQNSSNPTEFFQRTILPPQGNFGVESSFQTPLAAQFDLQLRF